MEKIKYFIVKYSSDDYEYIDDLNNYLENEIEKVIKFFEFDEFGEKNSNKFTF